MSNNINVIVFEVYDSKKYKVVYKLNKDGRQFFNEMSFGIRMSHKTLSYVPLTSTKRQKEASPLSHLL